MPTAIDDFSVGEIFGLKNGSLTKADSVLESL